MSTDITIAAVGDLLIKSRIIASARVTGDKRYDFDPIFEPVASYLRNADFTIGNLETNFAGPTSTTRSDGGYTVPKRNPKTGWPLLNCPDQFAATLKNLKFDVLSTANNHCIDNGVSGLKRTLKVLDEHELAHTGTARTPSESQETLIKTVKGIKIGVLAYTKGTNRMPLPASSAWAVNLIDPKRIVEDIKRLKSKEVDLIVACMHFGREYSKTANPEQKKLVQLMFEHGADIILGAHSHVIQPAVFYKVKERSGASKKKFAAYSLGNFISTRLYKNDHTLTGVITQIHVRKQDDGTTQILNVDFVPTWVRVYKSGNKPVFRVVPLAGALKKPADTSGGEWERMSKMHQHVKRHIPLNPDHSGLKVL